MHLKYVKTATEDPPSTSEDSIREGYLESISVLGSTVEGVRVGYSNCCRKRNLKWSSRLRFMSSDLQCPKISCQKTK